MTGTFIDTIIICTMTGLTIIVSGQWLGELNGAELTQAAFATTYGAFAPFLLTISLTLFAFTTIIGWNYYGERCWEYLFGTKTIPVYRVCYIAVLASAVFLKLEAIWALADIVNGLMAIPNLASPIGLGIIAGLFLGKPLGIFTTVFLMVKLGIAKKPEGAKWMHYLGASILAGIGFTMSIFLASLSFSDPAELTSAKAAIVTASILSGLVGSFVFKISEDRKQGNRT